MSGDPIEQALFKTGGLVGGVLGGVMNLFIPVPVVGTLVGEIVGEYVGDLLYVGTMGGGVDKVGDKLKEDWNNTIGNIVASSAGGSKEGPQRSDFPNTRNYFF